MTEQWNMVGFTIMFRIMSKESKAAGFLEHAHTGPEQHVAAKMGHGEATGGCPGEQC